MKKNTGPAIAVVIVVVIIGWMVIGTTTKEDEEVVLASQSLGQSNLATVEVKRHVAQSFAQEIVITGETSANRKVNVSSEASGKIIEVLKRKGDIVKKGDVIARIAKNDLGARQIYADAFEEQMRLEYLATKQLVDQGLQNKTRLAGSLAQYEQAKANSLALSIQLKNLSIKAPFAGKINDDFIEVGSFVSPGQVVVELYDFDPYLVKAEIQEAKIGDISVGMSAYAEMSTGEVAQGIIRFIGVQSKQATRTFGVEFEVESGSKTVASGITAELHIPLLQQSAIFVSPALLALDDNGQMGLKVIKESNKVSFVNVEIIATEPQGIWVSGLGNEVDLIEVGQGFVEDGDEVIVVINEQVSE